ncbi:hypothetical protein [Streptomyces lycii]|uniref:Cytoplasmic protein n=1 Tax=Streptomyces lycii TaxID=2654337 RepID=A0ABQ7FHZ3_9ACTN|nr:hypothetical protein [Streptomyces lycii]KAF4408609.1 hypothetical protein GCU69_12990 [Streptomyces lycii]
MTEDQVLRIVQDEIGAVITTLRTTAQQRQAETVDDVIDCLSDIMKGRRKYRAVLAELVASDAEILEYLK